VSAQLTNTRNLHPKTNKTQKILVSKKKSVLDTNVVMMKTSSGFSNHAPST